MHFIDSRRNFNIGFDFRHGSGPAVVGVRSLDVGRGYCSCRFCGIASAHHTYSS